MYESFSFSEGISLSPKRISKFVCFCFLTVILLPGFVSGERSGSGSLLNNSYELIYMDLVEGDYFECYFNAEDAVVVFAILKEVAFTVEDGHPIDSALCEYYISSKSGSYSFWVPSTESWILYIYNPNDSQIVSWSYNSLTEDQVRNP